MLPVLAWCWGPIETGPQTAPALATDAVTIDCDDARREWGPAPLGLVPVKSPAAQFLEAALIV